MANVQKYKQAAVGHSTISEALAGIDEIRITTVSNLKDTRERLEKRAERLYEKEDNLESVIAQRVEAEVSRRIAAIEGEVRRKAEKDAKEIYANAEKRNEELTADNENKEARGKELDKEIAEKEKNSEALGENCAQLQQDVEQLSADKESLCQSIEKMQQGKNANFKDFMAAMKWLYSADIQSVNAYIRNSQRERER